MCGIAGVYDYARREPTTDRDVLLAMRDTISHRGPDDAGVYVSPDRRVGLANRRLSIVDLDGGAQPMVGDAGEVLVFNGEIYNYPRLRARLRADGVTFRTTCDTEVILHLYARHGERCVDHLNGMFAFAIWDPGRGRLFFARDRIGEKPFYYTDVGGTLVFGSEIKALLEHPLVRPAVNRDAIGPYLTNLVTSCPETLFAGIRKLAPGMLGLCDERGLRLERYWDLFADDRTIDLPLDEAAAEVRRMLERSVHDRLMADVPVGVLLSGGLDSTTLVALLRERAHETATFSVGFTDHPEFDERAEARRVARHFGTPHHEVTVSEDDAIEFLPQLVHHQDEPLGDPVCIPLHFVCALAHANGIKVVLAGEGSDELFWGYTRYRQIMERERWLRALLRLPGPVRRAIPHAVPPGIHGALRELLEGISTGRPHPLHMPLGLTRHSRERFLGSKADARAVGWSPRTTANGDPVATLARDTQEYEFGLRLPELLLMRIDRFSMANSVEARVPFLDPDLVAFVSRLPVDHKLGGGEGKRVLKRAIAGIVPDWVTQRPKQGFDAPVAAWLETRLGAVFASLVDEDCIRAYFDADVLEHVLGGLRNGGGKGGFALWPILNFALWHKYWIEGEALQPVLEPLAGAGAR